MREETIDSFVMSERHKWYTWIEIPFTPSLSVKDKQIFLSVTTNATIETSFNNEKTIYTFYLGRVIELHHFGINAKYGYKLLFNEKDLKSAEKEKPLNPNESHV